MLCPKNGTARLAFFVQRPYATPDAQDKRLQGFFLVCFVMTTLRDTVSLFAFLKGSLVVYAA